MILDADPGCNPSAAGIVNQRFCVARLPAVPRGQEDVNTIVPGCPTCIPVPADLLPGLSKIAAFECVVDGIIEAFDLASCVSLSYGQFTIKNLF